MPDDRKLRALPPTPAPAPLDVPRGRRISAAGIIQRHYTDAVTGAPIVGERWIRENMPYKEKLSHSRVAWFIEDVDAVVEDARRTGRQIKDVRLDYLETAR